MSCNFNELKIDLEKELDVGVQTEFVVACYRLLKFKNKKCLGTILITEVTLLILSLIIIFPFVLLFLRNISINLGNDTTQFLLIITVAFLLWLGVNIYWFRNQKNVHALAHLIESIDQHNRVIDSLTILTTYQSHINQQDTSQTSQTETLLEALFITRKSLINSLKLESIIRKHSLFTTNRYQLITDLEQDLTHLMSLNLYSTSGEYEELLHQTLQIGIDINQEVQKMNSSIS